MRALITGGTGFVGRHLAKYLVSCGDDVAVTCLPSKAERPTGSGDDTDVPLPRQTQTLVLDVTDRKAVSEVVALLRPDAIYHLAARTFVPEGESEPTLFYQTNLQGTLNLLDAVQEHSKETRVLFVSSAEVYGEPRTAGQALTELSELRPASTYGVTKAAAELACFKYFGRNGLHIVRIRPFPHIGPGQSPVFAISGFAKQIAEIKLGKSDPAIKVGNLEARRDYTDVLDIVRGYREALENGKPGEVYNLCSGGSIGIGEMLQMLIARSGVEAEISIDPSRVRPVDVPELYGSFQKAQKDFGWRPRVEREASLDALLAYWIETLGKTKR